MSYVFKTSDCFLPIKPSCSSTIFGLNDKPLSPTTDAFVKALSITFLETLAKFLSPIKILKSFKDEGEPLFTTYLNNSSGSTDPGFSKPLRNIFLSALVNLWPADLWNTFIPLA